MVAVFAGVLANEGALKEALEAEKEIGLILDRGHDDGAKSDMLACKAIGQELIAEHCSFGVTHAQFLHGALQGLATGLSAVGVGD